MRLQEVDIYASLCLMFLPKSRNTDQNRPWILVPEHLLWNCHIRAVCWSPFPNQISDCDACLETISSAPSWLILVLEMTAPYSIQRSMYIANEHSIITEANYQYSGHLIQLHALCLLYFCLVVMYHMQMSNELPRWRCLIVFTINMKTLVVITICKYIPRPAYVAIRHNFA